MNKIMRVTVTHCPNSAELLSRKDGVGLLQRQAAPCLSARFRSLNKIITNEPSKRASETLFSTIALPSLRRKSFGKFRVTNPLIGGYLQDISYDKPAGRLLDKNKINTFLQACLPRGFKKVFILLNAFFYFAFRAAERARAGYREFAAWISGSSAKRNVLYGRKSKRISERSRSRGLERQYGKRNSLSFNITFCEAVSRIALLMVLIIGFLAPVVLLAQERNENFIITWKSAAMAPSFYQGKILPTKYSALKINFELTVNGIPVNLKNQEIQWFINQELKARGRGLRSLNLSPDVLASRDILARIVVKNFRGRNLEEIVAIPLSRPETVIEQLSDNLFRAWPFFFSALAGNLIFSWEVNGQTSLGEVAEPFLLELTTGGEPAGAMAVQAVIQNQINSLEMAKDILMVNPFVGI